METAREPSIGSMLGFCLPAMAWIAVAVDVLRPLVRPAWHWAIDSLTITAGVLIVAKIVNTIRGRPNGR